MIRQRYLNLFSSVLALLWGACSAPIVNAQAVKELPKSAEVAKSAATSPISADIYTPSDNCRGDPKWLVKNGLSRKTQFDTTRSDIVGLSILDADGKGGTRRGAHASWSKAGYLGRLLNDEQGHIYAYPVPLVSLDVNPVAKANIIYRIDTDTMLMEPFVELPRGEFNAGGSPFGVVALTYDCAEKALYAATLFGSTANIERGLIVRIDTQSRELRVVKRGLDALSLALVRSSTGKRMMVGTARDNRVVSFGFKANGELSDDSKLELELEQFETARDKAPRILRVDARGGLGIRAVPFDYSLVARVTIPTAELRFAPDRLGKYQLVSEQLTNAAPPRDLSPGTAPTRTISSTAPKVDP